MKRVMRMLASSAAVIVLLMGFSTPAQAGTYFNISCDVPVANSLRWCPGFYYMGGVTSMAPTGGAFVCLGTMYGGLRNTGGTQVTNSHSWTGYDRKQFWRSGSATYRADLIDQSHAQLLRINGGCGGPVIAQVTSSIGTHF